MLIVTSILQQEFISAMVKYATAHGNHNLSQWELMSVKYATAHGNLNFTMRI